MIINYEKKRHGIALSLLFMMYRRLFERGVGLTRHYFIKHHVKETWREFLDEMCSTSLEFHEEKTFVVHDAFGYDVCHFLGCHHFLFISWGGSLFGTVSCQ